MKSVTRFEPQVRVSLRNSAKFIRERGTDIALLAGAAICFGWYAWNQAHSSSLSGNLSAPIAHLTEGEAERKSAGRIEFERITAGTQLHNLDTLWVGVGHTARLDFYDGTDVTLSERTLVILKRPFTDRGRGKIEDHIRLITGVAKSSLLPNLIQNNLFKEVPRPADKPIMMDEGRYQLHPKDKSIILVKKPGTASISLSWPQPVTGYVALRNVTQQTQQYIEIQNSYGQAVDVEPGNTYIWQLVLADRSPKLGPFQFEVRFYEETTIQQFLKKNPEHPVEFLF